MFKHLLKISLLTFATAGALLAVAPGTASARSLPQQPTTFAILSTETKCKAGEAHPREFNGDEDIRSCCPASAGTNPNSMQCFFAKYLNPVVNLLAVAAGLIVLASVIAGGLQISASAGDSGKYAKGRERIVNSLAALAGFVFLYAFLQWVIPGGVL